MPGPVFIEGDRVTLHAIDEADIGFLRETFIAPNVRRTIGLRTPFTEHQQESWYEERLSGDGFESLLVCHREDDDPTPVGSISIGPTDDPNGEAEIGIAIAEPHWGNGYGTEAARLVTDYGFRELRCHRIFVKVFEGNERSRHIWETLGYTYEGTHREMHFQDGEYHDGHFYSVLADEWASRGNTVQ